MPWHNLQRCFPTYILQPNKNKNKLKKDQEYTNKQNMHWKAMPQTAFPHQAAPPQACPIYWEGLGDKT